MDLALDLALDLDLTLDLALALDRLFLLLLFLAFGIYYIL